MTKMCFYCGRFETDLYETSNFINHIQYTGTTYETVKESICSLLGYDKGLCRICATRFLESHISFFYNTRTDKFCKECGQPNLRFSIFRQESGNTFINLTVETIKGEYRKEDWFCSSECASNWIECPACARLTRSDYILTDIGCFACAPRLYDVVQSHKYVPNPLTFLSQESVYKIPRLYFGTEVEFHVGERDRDTVAGILEHQMQKKIGKFRPYYYKHDGSVQPGFEWVTMPMTIEYLQDNTHVIDKFFNTLERLVPDIHKLVNNHPHCGMHVHVSRDKLSRMHIFRLAAFVYSNSFNLTKLGRRPLNNYCEARPRRISIAQQSKEPLNKHDYRYALLNLQNEHTIEFRFPKSVTDTNIFMMTVELCQSLVEYTRNISFRDVSFAKFLAFVESNKRTYHNLIEYISQHGLRFDEYGLYTHIKLKRPDDDWLTLRRPNLVPDEEYYDEEPDEDYYDDEELVEPVEEEDML